MLAVPDFPHFRDITQADPAARARSPAAEPEPLRAVSGHEQRPRPRPRPTTTCPSTTPPSRSTCDDIDANEGATGRLYCTYNAALAGRLRLHRHGPEHVDYFHPSLSGQAKMAEDAWRADVWASMPLP